MGVMLRSTVEFDEDGSSLYWLHDFGWVPKDQATTYEHIPEALYAIQGSEFEDVE